jgi:hypothetical protein
MVEDFLEQLAAAIPPIEGGVEDVLRKKTKSLKKLELRLADRRKLSNDGYACVPFVLFVHIYSWLQGVRYPHTVLPKGNGCKHQTLW